LLVASTSYAHNAATRPDCPVLTLKTAAAKPDVYLSLDGSCSMSGTPESQMRTVVKQLVQHATVGGTAINYGLSMWATNREGTCSEANRVALLNDGNQTTPIVNYMNSGSWYSYGSTPQGPALQGNRNYYTNVIIPNDIIQCRKRYVLMITDGIWNCGANPCTVASSYPAIGVKIIAVAAFGASLAQVQCMANNSGGVAAQANNPAQLIQILIDILGTTLASTVTVSPVITGTIKDWGNPMLQTIKDNANLVTPVNLPTFKGDFKAFKIFDPDPLNPTKLNDVYTLLWDASPKVDAMNWASRNYLFTQDQWATCYRDAAAPSRPNCPSTAAPATGFNPVRLDTTLYNAANAPALLGVPNQQSARALIHFLMGRNVFCGNPARVCDATNTGQPWAVQGNNKPFKLYASIAEGGSLSIPPNALLDDTDYATFQDQYATRDTVFYAQSDSGGVHAFTSNANATGGTERWLFIPRENLSRIKNLMIRPQTIDSYTYFAQGRTVVYEQKTAAGWRSLLVFGLGAGGRSYYALDVTDPSSWNPASGSYPEILWAFTDDDNHSTAAERNQVVMNDTATTPGISDFGTMGLGFSVPAGFDILNTEAPIVFGSGYANSHLRQPDVCIGTALAGAISTPPNTTENLTGHSVYKLNAETGHLTGVTSITALPPVSGVAVHDIIRGQINAMGQTGLDGSAEIENNQLAQNYVFGGTLGHLFLWDGNAATPTHLSSARTSAEAESVLALRPIVRQPLVFSPSAFDSAAGRTDPCRVNNNPVTQVAYFGTGDDAIGRLYPPPLTAPLQYLFGVDLTSGAYPSYTQLPGSPITLGQREIHTGDARLARVQVGLTPNDYSNVVFMLSYTAAADACGSGFSTLWQFNACNLGVGGYDVNGGGIGASDRKIDLGSGRATAISLTHGKLLVHHADKTLDFSSGDGTADPPEQPTTTIWNYRIKD
jgi:hypothetical protein